MNINLAAAVGIEEQLQAAEDFAGAKALPLFGPFRHD